MFKKAIIIIIIFGLLLPNFYLKGETPRVIPAPQTIDEAKKMADEAIISGEKELPGIIERIWKNEVLPVWRGMWNWFSNLWNRHIEPRIQAIWQNIQELFIGEVEKRKPIIEEEIKKEKQEIRKEAPEVGRSIWERFMELIR